MSKQIFISAILFLFLNFYFSFFDFSEKSKINNKFTFSESVFPESKYRKIFGDDYKNALNYFRKNKTRLKRIFTKNNTEMEIIIPAVFPERIRYSIVKDYFETIFLEAVYTDLGSEYVDFSVGAFQMKPSFVEKLEFYIEKYPDLKTKYSHLILKRKKSEAERKERIRRLKSTEYQLNYISAFYDIINLRFNLSGIKKIEKIKFTASAYNCGFFKSKSEIKKYIDVKYFPYGANFPGKQHAYTDIAADFYINYFKKIFL